MSFSLKKMGKTGDTIVEVLICMAIVGLALGGAYGVAVRSLLQIREAEERSQAIRTAQQQVERLRQLIADGDPDFTTTTYAKWRNAHTLGFIINDDLGITDGYYPPACNSGSGPVNENDAVIVKDTYIVGQYYINSGFCLVGGGLAGGSQYDVVTFVVRIH